GLPTRTGLIRVCCCLTVVGAKCLVHVCLVLRIPERLHNSHGTAQAFKHVKAKQLEKRFYRPGQGKSCTENFPPHQRFRSERKTIPSPRREIVVHCVSELRTQ
uniref:Secreted protein n=1 Tax=Anopheles minimus TaxID=112268 RepID=A0A182WPK6_9DIPT